MTRAAKFSNKPPVTLPWNSDELVAETLRRLDRKSYPWQFDQRALHALIRCLKHIVDTTPCPHEEEGDASALDRDFDGCVAEWAVVLLTSIAASVNVAPDWEADYVKPQ